MKIYTVLCKVIATGCSGSGSPSFALRHLIGQDNFEEVLASDNHAAGQNL